MAQQTAVEFLENQLALALCDELKSLRGLFVVAKEMEKRQIMTAWVHGMYNIDEKDCPSENYAIDAEQYYKQNFNK